jgi:hypothetical protein
MGMRYKTLEGLLQAWGQWRSHAEYRECRGKYGQSQVAKMAGTIPKKSYVKRKCPKCYGTGFDQGKKKEGKCPHCKGAKIILEIYNLVDPRTIPATGPGGMYVIFDDLPPEFVKVDAALVVMEIELSVSILAHYAHYPSQQQQGRRLAFCNRVLADNSRHPIGNIEYEGRLRDARRKMAQMLEYKDFEEKEQQRKKAASKAGKRSAEVLSIKERAERARKAALARWRPVLHLKKKPCNSVC